MKTRAREPFSKILPSSLGGDNVLKSFASRSNIPHVSSVRRSLSAHRRTRKARFLLLKWVFVAIPFIILTCCSDDRGDERPVPRRNTPQIPGQASKDIEYIPPESALPKSSRLATDLQKARQQLTEKKHIPGQPQTAQTQPDERLTLESTLRNIVGSPVNCLDPDARAKAKTPQKISISIEVNVTQNGVISRAYVTSSLLTSKELLCIQRKVEMGRFPAPVPDAPRKITTTIVVQKKEETGKKPCQSGTKLISTQQQRAVHSA